jgi:hypothetical protein
VIGVVDVQDPVLVELDVEDGGILLAGDAEARVAAVGACGEPERVGDGLPAAGGVAAGSGVGVGCGEEEEKPGGADEAWYGTLEGGGRSAWQTNEVVNKAVVLGGIDRWSWSRLPGSNGCGNLVQHDHDSTQQHPFEDFSLFHSMIPNYNSPSLSLRW